MRFALLVGVLALLAVLVVGVYVTGFTDYLGNNPSTCNNCHVMDSVYENWYHAGHRQWTTCNDCHTPHALIPKYFIKALSGYHHVSAFLLGDIPTAIRAKESSRKIVQENCLRCHEQTVDNLDWQMTYTKMKTSVTAFRATGTLLMVSEVSRSCLTSIWRRINEC